MENRIGQDELRVKIYFEDTDAGGVVYHANYLRYMERGRVEWLAKMGFAQRKLAEKENATFVVRNVTISYISPARLEDVLVVRTRPEKLGAARLVLDQEIVHEQNGNLVVEAVVEVACIDPKSFRPARIPAEVAERIRERFPNL